MLKINIIGIGPGNPDLLTKEAASAIDESNVLIGDGRMLAAYAKPEKMVYETFSTSKILEIIQQLDPLDNTVGILVSGDVGFFSLAKIITDKLENCDVKRYCGISSLVYFAQALNMSWDDAKIISMHGRNNNIVAAVSQNKKVFSLTGGENSPSVLCKELCKHGLGDCLVYVGEYLSYSEEKITKGLAKEICSMSFLSLSVMMIINNNANSDFSRRVHGLPDEAFIRSKVPMTKQEIRAISLSKLAPFDTDIVYDIGAGTGSVSVELALLVRNGKVWAFERNPEAIELIKINKNRFNVSNLEIVEGEASEEIKLMPAPNSVFIGGSGGNLHSMLDTIYIKNVDARIVINAITLETLASVLDYYKNRTEYSLEVVNAFAARSEKIGQYNLMKAQNPVYVITAIRKGA
ncbi:MAG: precorrin-6y C5,15-methyltransferase (decarboxylating) subunit CbiE [Negativicutes bacterium]|nr:precorrin-6y C5,15-methyltransferase (decarboxylating) subunit CbiE [Negativicutes bacterium]